MKQSELASLLGKTIDDVLVSALVNSGGGKPLKSTTPNNSLSESIDKTNNVAYWARHRVINTAFYPPKKQAKKWVTYLWCVRLVEKEPSSKKPDPKPASFWDLSPMPTALTTQADIEKFFGPSFGQFGDELAYQKSVADGIDVTIRWNLLSESANSYWLKISEDIEMKPDSLLDPAVGAIQEFAVNAELMHVKWLFDRGYLALPKSTPSPPTDVEGMHAWVLKHLGGHLWASQLNPSVEHLFQFQSLTDQANYGLKKGEDHVLFYSHFTLLEATSQAAEFKRLEQSDYLAAIALVRNTPFTDATYAAFATAMDKSFERYKQLLADGYR